MGYIRMAIALAITLIIIVKVNNRRDMIVPVCAIYFLGTCLNDIFNAGNPLHLGDAFGISYQFGDMLLLILVGLLICDLFRSPTIRKNLFSGILACIFIIAFFAAVLGVLDFGMSSEWIGDLRSCGLFITGLMYFAHNFNIDDIKIHMKSIDVVMTIVLSISTVLWLLDLGLGIHVLQSQYNATLSDGGSTMRFIQPYEVISIAIYALYLAKKDITQKGVIGIKALIYIVAVILFQHRSIWLALGVGVAVILLEEIIEGAISWKLLLQVVLVVFLGAFLMIYGTGDIIDNIKNGVDVFNKVISGDSLEGTTANTRVQVWNAVIEDLQGISLFFGRPFGYGYGASIGWNVSPHSGYIRMLARTGWVGVVALAALMICAAIRMQRKQIIYGLEFLACVAAFMYGYDFTWSCGIIIGACVAISTNSNFEANKGENLRERAVKV